MTNETIKEKVRNILDGYLEMNNHRKTPERFAILDAVYDMHKHFSLDELGVKMEALNFRVSRATLYNTMRLFIELRLVVRHRFIGQTKYEACYNNDDHIHQICTVCGSVTEIDANRIVDAIENIKLSRFRKDGFTLYLYGVCSRCQAKISRQRNKIKQQKEDKANENR
ncbi:transcriptional repressor [Prevotella brunnea]|uniref:Ferric uptake regulation protein n=1 Tax=Prevotella brunnea TaxID=2508867 RepID=A0A5C8GLY0_9BACT|nr:Fur family transcriptional regulator [Prevotella brunnea]MDR0186724.1 transcriptional repressor [Prevotella brunnea]TXJ61878.1 transcriptional repressor [Prevotella brunnea]